MEGSSYNTPNNSDNMENGEHKKPSSSVKGDTTGVSFKLTDTKLEEAQNEPSESIPSGHVEPYWHTLVDKVSETKEELAKIGVTFVSDMLLIFYDWKTALFIATVLVALNIVLFFSLVLYIPNNNCATLVQVFDASRKDAVFRGASKSGNTHLCSTEMVSLRSWYFSLRDLEDLEASNLPSDTVCHMIQGRMNHSLIDQKPVLPERMGHPSMETHDLSWVEWYPCMFEGMSCADYGRGRHRDPCRDLADINIEGCSRGYVENYKSKFIPPGSSPFDKSQPYYCDNDRHNLTETTLEDIYAHFDVCSGLVSATFRSCPTYVEAIGIANGWCSLCTLIVVILLLPIGYYVRYLHEGKSRNQNSSASPTTKEESPVE